MNILIAFVAAAGIPSAVCSFCFWILEHKIQKREDKLKEERKRKKRSRTSERKYARRMNCIFLRA